MTQTELSKQISNNIGKTKVLELSRILNEQQFALRDLIDLTFHAEKDIAFRASWLLENIFLENPEAYNDELYYLLSLVSEVRYESCQRHYAKILMHITSPKAPKNIQQQVSDFNIEPIVEQCFDWMIDPKVKIAVKVFSSEALFNLRNRYPWITEELTNQIKFLMLDGTAAIQSRGRKLLALMVIKF